MYKKIILTFVLSLTITLMFAQKGKNNFVIQNFENGQIISSQDATLEGNLSLSSLPYDNAMVGVFFKYNKQDIPSSPDGSPVLVPKNNYVKIAGFANVKYNNENGPIKKGDYITSSSTPGIAMKATQPGMILGVALEDATNSNGLVKIRILIQYMR